MRRTVVAGALWVFVLVSAPASGAGGQCAVAVSPGSAAGARIADPCPTFSWGEVPRARSYELVVYRLGEAGEEAEPALRRSFAGSVSSWTPSLALCLQRGERYAWSVRAVVAGATTDWSAANLFQVTSGPGDRELELASRAASRRLSSPATARG